ncbi:MAG: SBBP repeat-containing protein, partial [Bryobacteraceae bacterium]
MIRRYALLACTIGLSQLLGAIGEEFHKLPLAFEKNQGQAGPSVDYLARGGGYSVFLSGGSARLTVRQSKSAAPAAVDLRLAGARRNPKVGTRNSLPGKVNYFIGNDPARWRTEIPTFGRVEYSAVYPGIDLAYYGNQGRLEYDFILAPGADPSAIRLAVDGARNIRVDDGGDLVLETAAGAVSFQKPAAYQEIAGTRRTVESHYVLAAGDEVRFAVGTYDSKEPLVIDPSLVYSTYLGGSNYDSGTAIVSDAQGNAYITGSTDSMDFPLVGAEQSFFTGINPIFVAKLSADGSSLLYSTYLGGLTSGTYTDQVYSIAVDSSG